MQNLHEAFHDHVLHCSIKRQYRSIVVLNGEIPGSSFFKRDVPIVAVDGGTNRLLSIGVKPDLVIGDLDSINPSLRANLNTIHLPDQDYCDFSKTMAHLKTMKLLPSIITGITGGAIDHILQNINIFLSTGSIFYTPAPSMVGYTLQKGMTHFSSLPRNTKISLLGIPRAQVSTKGLKWELSLDKLAFLGKNSCFNRSLSDKVSIEVHSGICLAMIYLEAIDDAGVH
ncbi:thiamine diphosphokinase [Wolbachia endosymbiont of Atemnus politus]|uniref:thiamine diphosphokinase n=1 Tax=Wolbachia endosymbiont of Atemnus politus TaxID=2682840 RepID=UPI0015744D71|nr:thiamine diphosphokinase [Wolbachia endosymbiont of Atemnus politus]NSX83035.1 thiamine diphosphokinase [Wolbachia endosymbiont of Atemnus politus]